MSSPVPSEHFFNKFEEKCRQLIESGYQQLRVNGNCDSTWGEEKFTVEMYQCMNRLVQTGEYPYMDVDLENNDISTVTGELGRIDFKVRKATLEINIYAYVECKLVSKDSNHLHQYRKNGLLRFLRGKYADRPDHDLGFMVGYVIKHSLDGVAKRLKSSVNGDSQMNIEQPLSEKEAYQFESGSENGVEIRILKSTHRRDRDLGELTISHMMLDFT